MTGAIIQVLTFIVANPGQAAELKIKLLELTRKRCQEDSCRKCNLLQDAITQENFILLEEWEAQDRLESKLDLDYFDEVFQEGDRLLAQKPSLQWFYVVDP